MTETATTNPSKTSEKRKEDPYKDFHMFLPKHINQGLNRNADRAIKNALLDSFKDNSIKFIDKTYTERCMYYELPHPKILAERPYKEEPKCIFEDIISTIAENDNKLKTDIIAELVDLKNIMSGSFCQMNCSIYRVNYDRYDVFQVMIGDELYYFLNGIITKIDGYFYLIGQLPIRPKTSDEAVLKECVTEFNDIHANINMSKISPKHKGTLSNLSDSDIEGLKDKYNNELLYDIFSIFHQNILTEKPETKTPKNKPKLLRHVVYRPFKGTLQTTFGEMTDDDSIIFNSCGIFVIRKGETGYKFSKLLLQGCRFCNVGTSVEKPVESTTGGANDKSNENSKKETKKTFRKRYSKKRHSMMLFDDETVEFMNDYLNAYTKYSTKITVSEFAQKTHDVKPSLESLNKSFKTYQELFTKIQSKIFSVYPVKKDDKTRFICNSFTDFVLFLFSLVPSTEIHQLYLTRCEGTKLYNNALETLLSYSIDECLASNHNILTIFSLLDDFYESIRTIGSIFDE